MHNTYTLITPPKPEARGILDSLHIAGRFETVHLVSRMYS